MESFNDVCNVLCARNSTEDWIFHYPHLKSREEEIVNTSDLNQLKKFINDTSELQNMMNAYVSIVLIKGSHYALEWKSEIRETLDYFLENGCSFNMNILFTLDDQEMMEDILSQVGVVAFIVKHYKDKLENLDLDTVRSVSDNEYVDYRVTKENILITLKSILTENPQWIQ